MENCDPNTHNNLVDPNEFSTSKIGTKISLQNGSGRDRVHAPIYVYLKTNKMKPGSKNNVKNMLRCLSNSNTDNLEDDKAALKDCKDFLSK